VREHGKAIEAASDDDARLRARRPACGKTRALRRATDGCRSLLFDAASFRLSAHPAINRG